MTAFGAYDSLFYPITARMNIYIEPEKKGDLKN